MHITQHLLRKMSGAPTACFCSSVGAAMRVSGLPLLESLPVCNNPSHMSGERFSEPPVQTREEWTSLFSLSRGDNKSGTRGGFFLAGGGGGGHAPWRHAEGHKGPRPPLCAPPPQPFLRHASDALFFPFGRTTTPFISPSLCLNPGRRQKIYPSVQITQQPWSRKPTASIGRPS